MLASVAWEGTVGRHHMTGKGKATVSPPSYGTSPSSYFCPHPTPKKCHAEHRGRSRSDRLRVEGNSRLPRQQTQRLAIFVEAVQMDSLRYMNRHWSTWRTLHRTRIAQSCSCRLRLWPFCRIHRPILYYHTTDQEKRHIFPIDPKLADMRTVTSSGTSSRRDGFRDEVENRDEVCVVTGGPGFLCDAAHLLPHSKGDKV